jgi:hypothetical protein
MASALPSLWPGCRLASGFTLQPFLQINNLGFWRRGPAALSSSLLKADLVQLASQLAESRFPLKYSHRPLVETNLFKVWENLFREWLAQLRRIVPSLR